MQRSPRHRISFQSLAVSVGVHGRVPAAFLAVLVIFTGCSPGAPTGQQSPAPSPSWQGLAGATGNHEPTQPLAASPELRAQGEAIYAKQCAVCHGVDGKGEGTAAFLLYPRPRDLVAARYRIVSTWEGAPTDTDLFRTISRGMPGSAMPSWAHLPEPARWALVHYIKSLAQDEIVVAPTSAAEKTGVLQPPAEPPFDASRRARALNLFASGCASCHGAQGKGDGVQKQIDDKGLPTRPRDLTLGIFKGSPTPLDVYHRIVAGLPGTPMPSSGYLDGADAWGLARLVLELSSPTQRARVEMRQLEIRAPRVASVPTHPDAGAWRQAPAIHLHLMPLWWRTDRPEELTVQALHDGKELAFLLSWFDETHDHTAIRTEDFRDAAAVQLSAAKEPPFFAMGNAGEPVSIWMWKSDRQADMEPAFQELDKIYPNVGIDSYPNLQRSALEQPFRSALTLESDPTFVTAWGAGNIVADPTRRSAVESLVAQGLGTLKGLPRPQQDVEAQGVHATNTYQVLFRRALTSTTSATLKLQPGTTLSAAFAVWNGSAGDRDGKKSVTIWQVLRLDP